jgi:protein-disulfide isomerase-like protein with CxxC motif
LKKKKSSRKKRLRVWWGVIIGLLGLGAGFAGMRKAFTTTGRISEHNRQRRYAEMLTREIAKKDKIIDKTTGAKIAQIRRTTLRRKKAKTGDSAKSFLSRTKEPW